MPVMDEFREEREAIKHGTFKQKYQYFKDYYRMPLIIILLVSAFVGILLYNFITKKEIAFYAVMLNCSPYAENEWFTDGYAEATAIDLDKQEITFDTAVYYRLNSTDEDSYLTVQKLDIYTGAGQLDVMLGAGDEFKHFANSILFKDLRDVLTDEQIEKYKPYFYYVDAALVDVADITAGQQQAIEISEVIDPRNPEDMERPMPVAIYVESSEKLNNAYYFKNAEEGIALGIYANSSHPEYALKFIDYLLTE